MCVYVCMCECQPRPFPRIVCVNLVLWVTQVSIHKRNQDFSGLHQSIEALKQERAATGTATEQLNAALQVCRIKRLSLSMHEHAIVTVDS